MGPSSIKPPWAKLEGKLSSDKIFSNKSLESISKSKSSVKEPTSPSINNLPKLVTQKSSEAPPMSPKLAPQSDSRTKESTKPSAGSNLPKLIQDITSEKCANPKEVKVSRHEQEISPKSPTIKQPPLVVPFPGKPQVTAPIQAEQPPPASKPVQIQPIS